MEEQNFNYPVNFQGGMYEDEESGVNFMELFRKLLKNKKLIAKWAGICAVIGVIAAVSAVSTYTVSSHMAPENSTNSASSGGLSSLASLAGINLGAITNSDALSPELYPSIVSSLPFVTELFYVPVKASYKGEDIECNYYEYLLNCDKKPWYKHVLLFPGKVFGWCLTLFTPKDERPPKGFVKLDEVDVFKLTRTQEGIVGKINKNVNVSIDKKTSVITVSVTDQDPAIAFQIEETVINNLKKYMTAYRTEKARADLEYYEELYEEAQKEYFEAQRKYASFFDGNQGIVRQSIMIEQERLNNEMELKFSLYNSCAQQVQMAKAQVQHETPVVTTIQPPSIPTRDNESGPKTVAAWILIGAFLSSVWILFGKDSFEKFKNSETEE
ncbi:MAG: chain-length determining protein [Bacteroidales bacterium]|nr:chain-length determining protein [Bacteroidales bacterium]